MSSEPEPSRGSIAVLVLGCASPPYDETIEAIRQTWGSARVPGVDVYYVYGVPHVADALSTFSKLLGTDVPVVAPDTMTQFGDVLIAGCADAIEKQVDCLLRKRLIAFEYLTRGGAYDWIYTLCATSYVGLRKLLSHAQSLPKRPFLSGVISVDPKLTTPFISGASMLMTADLAASLGRDRDKIIQGNTYAHADDLTIGHWVATHMSELSLESAVEHVNEGRPLPSDYVLISCRGTSEDYVMSDSETHVPTPHAFHYHFHSQKPDDMRRFHERYERALSSEATAKGL